MGLGRLLGVSVFGLLLFLSCDSQTATGDCADLDSCEKCISREPSQNLTDCVWVLCEAGNSSCTLRTEVKEECSVYNETDMCSVERFTPVSLTIKPATSVLKALLSTTKRTPTSTTETSPTSPADVPEFDNSSFNTASFIGGIVLVLGLQAVCYFVIKFMKSKDSTYQTLVV
ncbi:CD164 sialomucin-like 2 protein isoform X3 [Latimeria chalumnae]|uniref:CD164 sialomucin-like 2 protein isoform X3 n=1 Tax=Latimeria chalumnae TaxID=7897 RepID=UPI00313C5679